MTWEAPGPTRKPFTRAETALGSVLHAMFLLAELTLTMLAGVCFARGFGIV